MSTGFHRSLTRLAALILCMMQIDMAGPPQRPQAETESGYHQFRTAKRARFHFPGVTPFRHGLQIITTTLATMECMDERCRPGVGSSTLIYRRRRWAVKLSASSLRVASMNAPNAGESSRERPGRESRRRSYPD